MNAPGDPPSLSPFERALAQIDAAHAADPSNVIIDGIEHPEELLYAARMTAWLCRLAPGASEALQLAARCQHLRRWEIPRERFPMTRAGYLQWRTTLMAYHAEQAGAILRDVGYQPPFVERVQSLIRKEGLKTEPETQLLEDVVCLVFLENYFADFAPRHDEQKVIGILRKTWRKMSEQARAAALKLDLPPEARALVARALE